MPDLIRVRSAVPLDREDILVGRRSARAALARGSEGVPPELWRASPIHELEAMLWSGRYAVAVVGGRAVAGAGWEPLADGTVLVRDLFVRPEHAGRGLARRLLGHIGRPSRRWTAGLSGCPSRRGTRSRRSRRELSLPPARGGRGHDAAAPGTGAVPVHLVVPGPISNAIQPA